MKILIVSGKIGSGKSSLLVQKRGFFLEKMHAEGKIVQPCKIISADRIGEISRGSEISQRFFVSHPMFRGIKTKNQLRKKLFLGTPKTQYLYWSLLENLLHPQIQKKINTIIFKTFQSTYFKSAVRTLVFECPIPEKIFPGLFSGTISVITLPARPCAENFLTLKKHRKISVSEYYTFLRRQ